MAIDWYVVTRKDYVVQDDFKEIWLAAGSPSDALLLGGFDGINGTIDFYFNPAAAEIATDLIARYGAVKCPQPDRASLAPLVGDIPSTRKSD
jgi:hypothetical protein